MHKPAILLILFSLLSGNICGQDSTVQQNRDSAKTTVKTQVPVAATVVDQNKPAPGRKADKLQQGKKDTVQRGKKPAHSRSSSRSIKSIIDDLNITIVRLQHLNEYKVPDSVMNQSAAMQVNTNESVFKKLNVVFIDSNANPPTSDTLSFTAPSDSLITKNLGIFIKGDLLSGKNTLNIKLMHFRQDDVAQGAGPKSASENRGLPASAYGWIAAGLLLLAALWFFFWSKKTTIGAKHSDEQIKKKAFDQRSSAGHAEPARVANTVKGADAFADGRVEPAAMALPVAAGIGSSEAITMPTDRFFLAEIMITSGPRKKFMNESGADIDLGEDVCGFVANQRELLLWLLDGTSDLHVLKTAPAGREYFSSRLLAQSLANKLRLAFAKRSAEPLDVIMLRAIAAVQQDWLAVIAAQSKEEKEVLRQNILDKNFPECATTILIGKLSIEGELSACRSGDSKMLLFSHPQQDEMALEETTLMEKNEESNDRIFFRLILNEQNELDIVCNKPQYELVHRDRIRTIIAFSDGIGLQTERFLKQKYVRDPEEARNQIIYQAQGTVDDKSICFVEIKSSN